MKILIIYAYPHHDSFNGAIMSNLMENLKSEHQVKIIDLYQEDFDPVLRFDKTHLRRNLQFDREMTKYRDLTVWSEHLIFIFPIWWGGMPAILKGFIDRVFAAGFIYKYKGLRPEALQLKGRTAAILTTHDTPAFYVRFFQQDYGKVLKNQVLKTMAGVKTTKFLQVSFLRRSTETKRQKFLNKVSQYAKSLT